MAIPPKNNNTITQKENIQHSSIPVISTDKQKLIVTWDIFKRNLNSCTLGSVEETYALSSELLQNAPRTFLDKYLQVVKNITEFVQENLSKSAKATTIAKLKADPTNIDLKRDVYASINGEFLKYENSSNNLEYRSLNNDEKKLCLTMVFNEICGLGILEPLFRDTTVREIICNGPEDIQIEIGGRLQRVLACKFRDADHLTELINKLFNSVNKEITRMNPSDKARLHDNSRVFAVHTSVAPSGPSLNIRRHTDDWTSPDQLIKWGAGSEEMFAWLGGHINAGLSFVVNGGTGTGKALVNTTLIPTLTGFTQLKDIKVGDTIFDKDGKETKILDIFEHSNKDVYRVHFSNNKYIDCDLEHNWLVALNDNKFDYKVKTTGDLISFGVREKGKRNFIIPILDTNIEFNYQEISVHPYVFGLYLGSVTDKYNILSVSYELYNSYKNNFKEIFGNYKTKKQPKQITLIFDSLNIKKELEKYGIIKNNKVNRFIPKAYLYNDSAIRFQLLSGLIDTKGYVNNHSWKINDDLEFLKDIEGLSSSLGYKTSIYKKDKVCRLSIATSVCLTSLMSKIKQFNKFKSYNINRTKHIYITEIEKLNKKADMRCLTVDSPSHTFLAENYIVTHNTTALAALCGYLPNSKRIIVIEKNLEIKLPSNKMLGCSMETIGKKTSSSSGFEVTMRNLVENCTQMRPDVIICGEIVGPEAYDLIQAANTGHQVSTSIHSNTSKDFVKRMTSLVSQAELVKGRDVLDLIVAGVDLVITLERFYQDGSRKIVEVSEIGDEVKSSPAGQPYIEINPIWRFVSQKSNTDKVVGYWEKVGDISEYKKRKFGLGTFNRLLTKEELRKLY